LTTLQTLANTDLIKVLSAELIADDGSVIVETTPIDGEPGLWLVQNNTDDEAAVFATAETTISAIINTGPWSTSDTDGNNMFFFDNNNDLVLKNRKGFEKIYSVFGITLDI